jgi:hypothetical protein
MNPAKGFLWEEGLEVVGGHEGGCGRGLGEEFPMGEDGGFRWVTFKIFRVPGLRADCFFDAGLDT